MPSNAAASAPAGVYVRERKAYGKALAGQRNPRFWLVDVKAAAQ
ncbi:hypothetical protein CNECB9_5460013 [Cupriavidus necator]|uniref:Uncharacterized protein n=1 Tax=Cupriavidus necator TaxID=106590 RepID=A0A1K0J2F4_CUPNE|nr:hypothetical protein CNECB9_5460013 [Cupriavidus necator]